MIRFEVPFARGFQAWEPLFPEHRAALKGGPDNLLVGVLTAQEGLSVNLPLRESELGGPDNWFVGVLTAQEEFSVNLPLREGGPLARHLVRRSLDEGGSLGDGGLLFRNAVRSSFVVLPFHPRGHLP
jgi:hypothetical protein